MWEWNRQFHNYTLSFCLAKHSLLVCYTLRALWELSDINRPSSVCYFKNYAKEGLLKRLMVSVMLLWIQWDCLKLLLLLHSLLQALLLPPTTSTSLNFCCLRFSNYTQIRYQCISWGQKNSEGSPWRRSTAISSTFRCSKRLGMWVYVFLDRKVCFLA